VLGDPKALASLSTAFLSDNHSAIEVATSAESSRRREREQRAFGTLGLGFRVWGLGSVNNERLGH